MSTWCGCCQVLLQFYLLDQRQNCDRRLCPWTYYRDVISSPESSSEIRRHNYGCCRIYDGWWIWIYTGWRPRRGPRHACCLWPRRAMRGHWGGRRSWPLSASFWRNRTGGVLDPLHMFPENCPRFHQFCSRILLNWFQILIWLQLLCQCLHCLWNLHLSLQEDWFLARFFPQHWIFHSCWLK